MAQLAKLFQQQLDQLLGKGRVRVSIIHDDKEICINSYEREILYAICEQQDKYFNLVWAFSEKFLTKALTISLHRSPKPNFIGFAEIYKSCFKKRIQSIIDKYDNVYSKKSEYLELKDKYYSLLDVKKIGFEEYKKIRDGFENIRTFQL